MTEIEHIQQIEARLQSVFEVAAGARDSAQSVLSEIIDIRSELTRRQIEILKEQAETATA